MAGPSHLPERLRNTAPVAGDIGGLLFFAYWMNHARELGFPALLDVLLDLTTLLLVGASVLGYQLAQGTTPSAWIGWAGAAAIGMGFTGSLSLLCAGLALFGLAIVRCRVHPPLPGFLLIAGGVVLFMAQGFAPGFGKAHASPSPVWGALMGMALVAIAGAMADLDALHRGEASSEVPLGSGDAPPRRVR